jgi:hypothetical protein
MRMAVRLVSPAIKKKERYFACDYLRIRANFKKLKAYFVGLECLALEQVAEPFYLRDRLRQFLEYDQKEYFDESAW